MNVPKATIDPLSWGIVACLEEGYERMVGSVERIEQELASLDQATRAIADEFYNAYSSYLKVLGQAVRQQLILASYHVCTQGYPEAF